METHEQDQQRSRLVEWLYQHAVTGLAAIAFGAWAINVQDAKNAYVSGQNELVKAQQQVLQNQQLIMAEQERQRIQITLIGERQDRNISMVNDHELRLRRVEVHHDIAPEEIRRVPQPR